MDERKYIELVLADICNTLHKKAEKIINHPDWQEATEQIKQDYAYRKNLLDSGGITNRVFEHGCVSATSNAVCLTFGDFAAKNIVLNIPHSSAKGVRQYGWDEGIADSVRKWTDWHTDILFAVQGDPFISPVAFPYSRFVCDVERLKNDPLEKKGQGIIYTEFDGIRRTGNYSVPELMAMYDAHINALKAELDRDSILIDCHSFPSDLSDIEICIGYNDDWSKPSKKTIEAVKNAFKGFKIGVNSPYSNSISPVKPGTDYQSIMIEINKKLYIDGNGGLSDGFKELRERILGLYRALLNR